MSVPVEENLIQEQAHGTAETTVSTETHAEEISHEVTLYAEPIIHFKYFTVTNALATSWVVVIIIAILAVILNRKIKEIPGKIQNLFEIIVEGALSLCDQVTNSRALSMRIFPIAISAFFFILINNWLGIFPFGGFGLLEDGAHGLAFIPFLRGGTADINTTIALAVIAVLGANIFGVLSIGIWKTINKYINLKAIGSIYTKVRKDPTVIIVAPITFFVGLIEIAGEFAKVASLSFRLFGNILAGEVLLASISALLSFVAPIPFFFLEILVGVVQALIFSILLVVYFTVAASDHDHEESHAEHEGKEHTEHEVLHA
jgi:F-type H+-transporting ATPase subunit a